MERDANREESREHKDDRVKTAREILEERLAKMGSADAAAAEALREAAERAPEAGAGAGAAGAPAAERAEDKELADLRKKAAERDEYYDQMLRARADLDNYQKRTRREMAEYRDFAVAGIMAEIASSLDTLDMALRAAEGAKSVESLAQGVALARDQLEKIILDRGATRIATEGTFDPKVHEAVLTEERSDVPPGTITAELRRGYAFKERLIRPAQVRVATAPQGAPGASSGSAERG